MVGFAELDERATDGRVVSYVRVSGVAAALVLPAVSDAPPAGMSTVTAPSAAGETMKV